MKKVRLNPNGEAVAVLPSGEEAAGTQCAFGIAPKTNWDALKSLSDEDVALGASIDEDNPLLTDEELTQMQPVPNVKQIRTNLKLSQSQFAKEFQLSVKTVQDWEQGRTQPDQAARTLLQVIAVNPDAVSAAIAGKKLTR
jgi:putative transcriptional regulator